MAEPIELLPMNFGEYNRSVSGSGSTWPVDLSVGGQTGLLLQEVGVSATTPEPDPYTGYPPPPDGYSIVLSSYQRQMWFFLYDVSNVDWEATGELRLLMHATGQSGFVNAFETAVQNDPNVGPMAPVHSGVHTLSGDWLTGSFDDLSNLDTIIAAYDNLESLAGTAFSGVSILDWFSPLYNDDSTSTFQQFQAEDRPIPLSGQGDIEGADWAGLLIAFDGVPSWFSGTFTIDTFDPEANPVQWTFWNIYNDSAGLQVNPVFGVSLNVIPATPDEDDDPRLLPDIAISATATLGIDGPLLRVGGLAESPPDRRILSHAARQQRGW